MQRHIYWTETAFSLCALSHLGLVTSVHADCPNGQGSSRQLIVFFLCILVTLDTWTVTFKDAAGLREPNCGCWYYHTHVSEQWCFQTKSLLTGTTCKSTGLCKAKTLLISKLLFCISFTHMPCFILKSVTLAIEALGTFSSLWCFRNDWFVNSVYSVVWRRINAIDSAVECSSMCNCEPPPPYPPPLTSNKWTCPVYTTQGTSRFYF